MNAETVAGGGGMDGGTAGGGEEQLDLEVVGNEEEKGGGGGRLMPWSSWQLRLSKQVLRLEHCSKVNFPPF